MQYWSPLATTAATSCYDEGICRIFWTGTIGNSGLDEGELEMHHCSLVFIYAWKQALEGAPFKLDGCQRVVEPNLSPLLYKPEKHPGGSIQIVNTNIQAVLGNTNPNSFHQIRSFSSIFFLNPLLSPRRVNWKFIALYWQPRKVNKPLNINQLNPYPVTSQYTTWLIFSQLQIWIYGNWRDLSLL